MYTSTIFPIALKYSKINTVQYYSNAIIIFSYNNDNTLHNEVLYTMHRFDHTSVQIYTIPTTYI